MKYLSPTSALLEHGERTNEQVGNCLLIHGGGLCATSKDYLCTLAEAIYDEYIFDNVFLGFYSFECFFKAEEWIKNWTEVRGFASSKPGGYFGTSRGVVVEAPETVQTIVKVCKDRNITHWFIAGGDGSCRAAAAVAPLLEPYNITVVIPQVLTLDGINGAFPLGVMPAVEKAWETINDVAATSLQTRQNGAYCPLIVEVMGRNRNEPLCYILKKILDNQEIGGIPKNSIQIYALPAGYVGETDMLAKLAKLIEKAPATRHLILISEGFGLSSKMVKEFLETGTKLKCRTHVVGYTQQMSGYSDNPEFVKRIVKESIPVILQGIEEGKSFSVIREEEPYPPVLESIDYLSKLNPGKGQVASLTPELADILDMFDLVSDI